MFFSKSRKSTSALLALAIGLSIVSSDLALAKTPKPTQAQIDAAKKEEEAKAAAAKKAAAVLNSATKTLNQLAAIASTAQVAYNKALKELAIAKANARAAAEHAAKTQAEVSKATRVIGKMASNAYKLGGDFSNISALLSANGPQDLIDQLTTLDKIGNTNTVALKRFKVAEAAAKVAKLEADRTKAAQESATLKVAAAKKTADEAKAAQQKEVNKLRAVQNKLAAELAKAKNFRVSLEVQRQLALLEESNAATASKTPNQFKVWPNKGFTGRSTIRSTEEMRTKAVAFAKKQVLARKPYIWGAQGPNAFDCSGLVYAAYKSAGLGYPSWGRLNAALYFVATKRVPFSELLPGDLLFYSYDGSVQNIHHITIYAGNGMMWEANSRKVGLIYSNMYSIKGLMPSGGRV
ncbi:Spr Cell wall-associated hydrolases (invasion-associated proteins) [actinobacterium SCGC AAA044-D11]|jgi:cell wall-associated NlpC family hydrolase